MLAIYDPVDEKFIKVIKDDESSKMYILKELIKLEQRLVDIQELDESRAVSKNSKASWEDIFNAYERHTEYEILVNHK